MLDDDEIKEKAKAMDLFFYSFKMMLLFMICVCICSYVTRIVYFIKSIIFGDNLSDEDVVELSKIFSQYIYFVKHDFEEDLIDSLLKINHNFQLVINCVGIIFAYVFIEYSMLKRFSKCDDVEGLITSRAKLFIWLKKILIILVFVAYFIVYVYTGSNTTAIKADYSEMFDGLNSNVYMRRTYFDRCNELILESSQKSNKYKNLFIIGSVVLYIILTLMELYGFGCGLSKENLDELKNIWTERPSVILSKLCEEIDSYLSEKSKKFLYDIVVKNKHLIPFIDIDRLEKLEKSPETLRDTQFTSAISSIEVTLKKKLNGDIGTFDWITCNIKYFIERFLGTQVAGKFAILIIGAILMLLIWKLFSSDIESYIDAIMYILNSYNGFAAVVYESREINRIFDINSINHVELRMDEYRIINVEYDKFSSVYDMHFLRKFENLLFSGDIVGARNYVMSNDVLNDELKDILLKLLDDKSSILLKDIGMSFIPRCNSFYLKKYDKYVSLVSPHGRILKIAGDSGSGKSTIGNTLLGDGKFFSSFINGKPAYLISAKSRSVLNYFSEQYVPFLEKFSLMQNFQIADKNVNENELKYLFDRMNMKKYFEKLNVAFSMIRFSHGQHSRILLNRVFISLNCMIKQAASNMPDGSVKDMLLKSLVSDDISSEDVKKLSNFKLNSFFVVLDEPLSVLDHKTAHNIMKIIKKYSKLGITFVIVDHTRIPETPYMENGTIKTYADDVVMVNDKNIEISTIVDGKMINLNDIEFDENGIAILGDTIAYLHDYNKIDSVGDLKNSYLNGEIDNINVCKIGENRVKELLSILEEHNLNKPNNNRVSNENGEFYNIKEVSESDEDDSNLSIITEVDVIGGLNGTKKFDDLDNSDDTKDTLLDVGV